MAEDWKKKCEELTKDLEKERFKRAQKEMDITHLSFDVTKLNGRIDDLLRVLVNVSGALKH